MVAGGVGVDEIGAMFVGDLYHRRLDEVDDDDAEGSSCVQEGGKIKTFTTTKNK